jgi:hypothetical protein
MGWELIKGWVTPYDVFLPQTIEKYGNDYYRIEGKRKVLLEPSHPEKSVCSFKEKHLKMMPEYFQYTPDLPEGWVKDTEESVGWILYDTAWEKDRISLAHRSSGYWWADGRFIEDKEIKAVYPIQKPKI